MSLRYLNYGFWANRHIRSGDTVETIRATLLGLPDEGSAEFGLKKKQLDANDTRKMVKNNLPFHVTCRKTFFPIQLVNAKPQRNKNKSQKLPYKVGTEKRVFQVDSYETMFVCRCIETGQLVTIYAKTSEHTDALLAARPCPLLGRLYFLLDIEPVQVFEEALVVTTRDMLLPVRDIPIDEGNAIQQHKLSMPGEHGWKIIRYITSDFQILSPKLEMGCGNPMCDGEHLNSDKIDGNLCFANIKSPMSKVQVVTMQCTIQFDNDAQDTSTQTELTSVNPVYNLVSRDFAKCFCSKDFLQSLTNYNSLRADCFEPRVADLHEEYKRAGVRWEFIGYTWSRLKSEDGSIDWTPKTKSQLTHVRLLDDLDVVFGKNPPPKIDVMVNSKITPSAYMVPPSASTPNYLASPLSGRANPVAVHSSIGKPTKGDKGELLALKRRIAHLEKQLNEARFDNHCKKCHLLRKELDNVNLETDEIARRNLELKKIVAENETKMAKWQQKVVDTTTQLESQALELDSYKHDNTILKQSIDDLNLEITKLRKTSCEDGDDSSINHSPEIQVHKTNDANITSMDQSGRINARLERLSKENNTPYPTSSQTFNSKTPFHAPDTQSNCKIFDVDDSSIIPQVDMTDANNGRWPELGFAVTDACLKDIQDTALKTEIISGDGAWLLRKVAERLDTIPINIQGDGHCFFRAVYEGLKLLGYDGFHGMTPFEAIMDMRQKVGTYMTKAIQEKGHMRHAGIFTQLSLNKMSPKQFIEDVTIVNVPQNERTIVPTKHYADETAIEIVAKLFEVQLVIILDYGSGNSGKLQISPMNTATQLGSGPIPDIFYRLHLYRSGEHYTLYKPTQRFDIFPSGNNVAYKQTIDKQKQTQGLSQKQSKTQENKGINAIEGSNNPHRHQINRNLGVEENCTRAEKTIHSPCEDDEDIFGAGKGKTSQTEDSKYGEQHTEEEEEGKETHNHEEDSETDTDVNDEEDTDIKSDDESDMQEVQTAKNDMEQEPFDTGSESPTKKQKIEDHELLKT